MSWSKSASRRKVLTGLGGTLVGSSILSACGFQPVYKQPSASGGPAPTQEMAAIKIRPIEGRTGQDMHNLLRDRLNPAGQPAQPKYILMVDLTQRQQEQAIQEDETASRVDVIMTARYRLLSSADNSELLRGSVRSVNSYDILDISVYYSTTTSENDAVKRSLVQLSEDIRLRLAVYFAEDA